MKFGSLDFEEYTHQTDLVAGPVAQAIGQNRDETVFVTPIDESFSDTANFAAHYGVGMETGANCVIVEARRGERTWYAACLVLATTRADVNNVVRRHLDARKISFAPMETATSLTSMEYGGITPLGLPRDWPILIDTRVAASDWLIIGSGIRGSKLLVSGQALAHLPGATVIDIAQRPPA